MTKTFTEQVAFVKARLLCGGHPVVASCFEAVLIAMNQPGSLVRITSKSVGEIAYVTDALVAVLVPEGLLKGDSKNSDFISNGEHGPILELKNGSGIELVVEKQK